MSAGDVKSPLVDDGCWLFVYGTLMPGLAPGLIREVVDKLWVAGRATVRGTLYHLGRYPGFQLDYSDQIVHGFLLRVEDEKDLAQLDWYEGFVASDQAGSLFLRVKTTAQMVDGPALTAWVYVYNRDARGAGVIESGRWG